VSRALALAACALLAGVLAGPAAAADVTGAELRELAARARDDAEALAALREVDAVDGRRVDVERLLRGAEGDELDARLRALAAGSAGGRPPDASAARRDARTILAERRFREHELPRPLRRPLEWLSGRLRPVTDALRCAVDRLADPLPGGRSTFWLLVSAALLAVAALLAARVVRRRARVAVERARTVAAGPVDPRRLEREAEMAERRGDLERALRLRFRAGLLRLQRAEVVPPRDSLTSGDVARRLRSPEFDRLAAAFDEVVYGGRDAEAADLDAARRGWPRVLEAVVP
jgi:hypothetical protein